MNDILIQIWAHDIYRKLILSVGVWLAAFVLGRVLPWLAISRLPDESPHIYLVRKVTTYLVNGLAILLSIGIWMDNLGNLSVTLGILAAGLAFALQEVIGNTARWVSTLAGRPFTIGDRIETGEARGAVVNISIKIMPQGQPTPAASPLLKELVL